jgi:hypothetical protein
MIHPSNHGNCITPRLQYVGACDGLLLIGGRALRWRAFLFRKKNYMKRIIASLTIQQNFRLYKLDSETYTIDFYEGLFGRSIKFRGRDYFFKSNAWKGTEFYSLTVCPWLKKKITTKELILSIEQVFPSLKKKRHLQVVV